MGLNAKKRGWMLAKWWFEQQTCRFFGRQTVKAKNLILNGFQNMLAPPKPTWELPTMEFATRELRFFSRSRVSFLSMLGLSRNVVYPKITESYHQSLLFPHLDKTCFFPLGIQHSHWTWHGHRNSWLTYWKWWFSSSQTVSLPEGRGL